VITNPIPSDGHIWLRSSGFWVSCHNNKNSNPNHNNSNKGNNNSRDVQPILKFILLHNWFVFCPARIPLAFRKLYIIQTGFSTDVLATLGPKEWAKYGWLKHKTISLTGRGGQQGCETSRLPHFPDNRLANGGQAVSLTRRPPFTPRWTPRNTFC
jgi:hypothetical protein